MTIKASIESILTSINRRIDTLDRERQRALAELAKVLRAGNQVTFPVAGNRTVLNFRWTFTDRDRIDDLTSSLTRGAGVLCAPHNTPRAKMADQFFLQDAAGLNEQTAVNRLVGHVHIPIVCKVHLEPTRNLLG